MTLDLAPTSRNSNPDEQKLLAVSRDGRRLERIGSSTETDIWQLPLP